MRVVEFTRSAPGSAKRRYIVALPDSLPNQTLVSGALKTSIQLDAPDYGEVGATLLPSIVEKLEAAEWSRSVMERVEFYRGPSAERLHPDEVIPVLRRFASAGGMNTLLQASPEVLSRTDENLRPIINSLVQDASRVRARRTIFALPRSVTAADWADLWQRFLFGIAHGVIQDFRSRQALTGLKDREDGELNYSFCFVGDTGSSTALPRKEHLYSVPQQFADMLITQASSAFRDILEDMQRPGPVLLEGPTGSGKSLAARLFAHHVGKDLITINVSAIREELLEARVKGYKEGTFTGAEDTPGWFEKANGQVLLLDEFQKAPSWVQTQLLDALGATSDTVEVSRIGEETKLRPCEVKVVLAINQPLAELREKESFREDLFYRMRTVVRFAPLDHIFRSADASVRLGLSPEAYVRLLFLIYRWKFGVRLPESSTEDPAPAMRSMFPTVSAEAVATILSMDWPGNFRELEKVCADLLHDLDLGTLEHHRVSAAALSRALSYRALIGRTQKTEHLVALIEDALRKENFRLTKAPQHLRELKIGDVATLKKRLQQLRDQLSLDVRSHPKIARLLYGTRKRAA